MEFKNIFTTEKAADPKSAAKEFEKAADKKIEAPTEMQVEALREGFYANRRIVEGDQFWIKSNEFSTKWMKKIK
jgi:uncharacterized iron-regulated protein